MKKQLYYVIEFLYICYIRYCKNEMSLADALVYRAHVQSKVVTSSLQTLTKFKTK